MTLTTDQQTTAALDRKREATAQARAALAGITLHITTADDGRREFIATRWSLTRSFSDIGEVEGWLRAVTGRAA